MGLYSKIPVTGGFIWTSGLLTASAAIGRGSGMPAGTCTFTDGTGVNQANCVFLQALSITAGATATYDLKGGGGELDVLGQAMAMTAVKLVIVEVTTPGSSTSLQFGPMNQANAAQLWFQATTANFYDTVMGRLYQEDTYTGWALDATHKVVAIKNPGLATVAGTLLIIGTK